ncbi:MAG: CocE/NonD family hydrolase, partial [Anaerolineales bacterium]|nr:CocE/NonD family hydrolase [Anaerolineales bacterium]
GSGYDGANQFLAASQAPPHLVAIFPVSAGFDYYDFIYPGGAYRAAFVQDWGRFLNVLDLQIAPPPVDADPGGRLMAQARAEHLDNWDLLTAMNQRRFRAENGFGLDSPANELAAINQSGVAAYIWTGWLDGFVRDGLLWYANLTGPRRLVVGPWEANPSASHYAYWREFTTLRPVEQLRWFDYWLKGIENGIMAEAPVTYATVRAPGLWAWQTAPAWPPPEAGPAILFAAAGPSGSVASRNDGRLAPEPPAEAEAYDDYLVDPTTTTGTATRWDNLAGKALEYHEMRPHDEQGLTYTTPPLSSDLTLSGSPVLTLYLSTAAPDLDLFAYLEEVNARGQSEYVTEGVLRASYRAVTPAPFENFGLPFHPGQPEFLAILPQNEPVALIFDLLPISNTFQAGKRLRLTLTGADAGHTEPLAWAANTSLRVLRSRAYPTHLALPIAPTP